VDESSYFAGLSDIMNKESMMMKDGSIATFEFAPRKDTPTKGRSLKTTLVVSIGDSATGVNKTIQVNRLEACSGCVGLGLGSSCQKCKGDRVLNVALIANVDVPPGVENG
jgi:DnaJ-class molecular chaperone